MKNTKLSTWAGVCIAYHLAQREEKNNKCDTFSAGVNFYSAKLQNGLYLSIKFTFQIAVR